LQYIEKAIELNTENDNYLDRKGLILYKLGNYEEAIKFYNKALKIDSEDPTTLTRKGMALHGLGNYERAITYYDMALDIDPDKKRALYHKGNTLYEMGNHDEALTYFDKVLEIDPDHLEALEGKAVTLESMGKPNEAKKYYEKLNLLEGEKTTLENEGIVVIEKESQIPDWVRNNAEWWAQGAIGDNDFVSGIQYLIKEDIIQIPETAKASTADGSQEIPSWIKNNADWWAQGLISDDDFVKGIQYLVENGIIVV